MSITELFSQPNKYGTGRRHAVRLLLVIAVCLIVKMIPNAKADAPESYWSLKSIRERETKKDFPEKKTVKKIEKLEKVDLLKPYFHAIFDAAEIGCLDLVKKLSPATDGGLKAKGEDGLTLLHLAASSGNLDLVKCLVEEGKIPIDAEMNDQNRSTPFSKCVWSIYLGHKENNEIAKYLLQKGAKLDRSVRLYLVGRVDLMRYVLLKGDIELIKECVKHGGELPEQIDGSILEDQSLDVIKYLMSQGIDLDKEDIDEVIPRTALYDGDEEKILFLLKHGGNVDYVDMHNQTALLHAAEAGNLSLVKLLIKNKASVSPEKCKKNALYYAATSGNLELFNYLLQEGGCSISSCNSKSSPLIHAAAIGGNKRIIDKILAAKIPIDQKDADYEHTVLHVLAYNDKYNETFKYMLGKGADINALNRAGYTVLDRAIMGKAFENTKTIFNCEKFSSLDKIKNGLDSIIRDSYSYKNEQNVEDMVFYLLDKGVSIDSPGLSFYSSPHFMTLAECIKNGYFRVADYLLEHGYSLSEKGEFGITLFEYIADDKPKCFNFEETIKYLKKKGVDINSRDTDGDTALSRLDVSRDEEATALLQQGLNPNLRYDGNRTVLMTAIKRDATIEFIEALLDGGANIFLKDEDGKTALVYAAENHRGDIMDLLFFHGAQKKELRPFKDDIFIESAYLASDEEIIKMIEDGANVNYSKGSLTALHYLSVRDDISLKTIKYVIDQGANVNVKNTTGITPLLAACSTNNESIAILLIDNGALVNVFDSNGTTPLMIASAQGLNKLVLHLIKSGADVKKQDKEGRNALTYARMKGQTEIADLLQKEMQQPSSASRQISQSGTGFAISKSYVVTALHVVKDADKIELKFGDSDWIPGKIEAQADSLDIAVLKVETPLKNYLPLTTKDEIGAGDNVFTMGYPAVNLLGNEIKYSSGVINAMSGVAGDRTLMQVSVPIQPGNSGSPLLNEDGEVIGMLTATAALPVFLKMTGSIPQNVNWAVKAEYISLCIDKQHSLGKKKYKDNREKMQDVRKSTCLIVTNRKE